MNDQVNPHSYVTKRTTMWRSRDINDFSTRMIDEIEECGCFVMSVAPLVDDEGLGFTYTIGVNDTCGQPELIAVGLPSGTAHAALMRAVEIMKSGVDLEKGRFGDLIGNVECEFRPVASKWVEHTMLSNRWYYEGATVPGLQLVYPDLQNRFEDDEGFDQYFKQPNLTQDAEFGEIEQSLWNMTK